MCQLSDPCLAHVVTDFLDSLPLSCGRVAMLGPAEGKPIALAPVNDLGGLALAEGIEDALSIHLATGLGAWAAGCANRLPALARAVPHYVTSVTVAVDDDEAGRRYAHELAQQLRNLRGRRLEVRMLEASRWRGAA